MKKLLIGMLITCSLGLVACRNNNTENSSTNSKDGTGMTDGTNPSTNNSNTPGNKVSTDIEKSKKDVEDLYTDFNNKVENGVDKIDTADWEKYKTGFENKMNSIGNTIEDTSLQSTMDYMRNLVGEYDKAIKDNVDVAKEKVEEMKNKIEEYFK